MEQYETKRDTYTRFFRRWIAMLLCLSFLPGCLSGFFVTEASAAQNEDSFELTEDQADSLMEELFGDGIQPLGMEDGEYAYALTEAGTQTLLENLTGEEISPESRSNTLPEGYTDNSNAGLEQLLASLPGEEDGITAHASETQKKVDIVFIIDSTGSMYGVIEAVKNNVAKLAKHLADQGLTLRLGLIDYQDITHDGLNSTVVHKQSHSPWFNLTGFINALKTVKADDGGDWEETPIDALGHLTNGTIPWASDAYKFAILVTDADYKTNNQHGIKDMDDMITRLQKANIQVSVVTDEYYCMERYGPLAGKTGGVQANIYSDDFGVLMQEYADAVVGATQTRKDYTLRVSESATMLPVANATITWTGGYAVTDSSGIAVISSTSAVIQNLKVTKEGYFTTTVASQNLIDYGTNSITLKKNSSYGVESGGESDLPFQFQNPGTATDTWKGPSVNLLGKAFSLFELGIGFDIPFFSDAKIQGKLDEEEKTWKVLFGVDAQGKDWDDDSYWKKDYQKYKSLVQTVTKHFTKKSAKDIYNEFRTLRKNYKPEKAKVGLPVDMEILGFIEWSYATGTHQIVDGGVILGISLKEKTLAEYPIPAAPYVFLKLTFEASGKGTFSVVKLSATGKYAVGVDFEELEIEPTFYGSANVGVPKLASVGGGFTLGATVTFDQLPPAKLKDMMTIEGKLGYKLELKILGFKGKAEDTIASAQFYPTFQNTSKSGSPAALSDEGGAVLLSSIGMEDLTPILPREMPMALDIDGKLSDSLTFDKDAYEDSTPQIIAYKSGYMMVWVDSVPARSADTSNHMALYYSIYTSDSGWSAPAMVANDSTADFGPSLILDNDGNPVVVWQNAKADVAVTTLEQRLANLEICAAVYDATTKSFGEVTTITPSEGKAPLAVQATVDSDGKVWVYWLENSVNSPLLAEGTTKILMQGLDDSGPTQVQGDIENLDGFAVGAGTYAYASDGHLYCGSLYWNAVGENVHSMQFAGDTLYWSDSKGFRSFKNNFFITEGASLPAEFTVLNNGSSQAIIMSQTTDYTNSTIYASVKTNDQWSAMVPVLTESGLTAGSLSGVLTDSCILWASAVGEKLAVRQYAPAPNVTVGAEAYVSVFDRKPGDTISVLVELENTGLSAASIAGAKLADDTTVNLEVQDEEGWKTLTSLAPGEAVTARFSYTLPTDFVENHTITAHIMKDSDTQWGDTSVTVQGFPDLVVSDVTAVRNADGTATVTATIKNEGTVTAAAPTVTLTKESVELITPQSDADTGNTLSDLAPGTSETVSFTVPATDLTYSNIYEYKRFTVTAATETEEYSVANNSASALLGPKLAESVTFNKASVTLEMGRTEPLAYTAMPADAMGTVSFMSDDLSIVTVDQQGKLTPVNPGTTKVRIIAVEATENAARSASLMDTIMDTITVTVIGTSNVAVTSVEVTPSSHSLKVGETVTLTAKVLPTDATNQGISWQTDTSDLLTLTPNGNTVVVTAVAAGEGKVTAVTSDGAYTTTATIQIAEKDHAEENPDQPPIFIPTTPSELTITVDGNTATVTLPEGMDSAVVTIPYENAEGLVVCDAETGEIIPFCVVTEEGIKVLVSGDVTLEIVNNDRNFTDVADHWAESFIDFVTERELYDGMTTTTFGPDAQMTQAMLIVVLAGMDGNAASGSDWYTWAVQWGIENDIFTVTDTTTEMTREDFALMLFNYAGKLGLDTTIRADLSVFPDADEISASNLTAMQWAVAAGLMEGRTDGTIDPTASATRAEVAVMLMNFILFAVQ